MQQGMCCEGCKPVIYNASACAGCSCQAADCKQRVANALYQAQAAARPLENAGQYLLAQAERAQQATLANAKSMLEEAVRQFFVQAGAPAVARLFGYHNLAADYRLAAEFYLPKVMEADDSYLCWGRGLGGYFLPAMKEWLIVMKNLSSDEVEAVFCHCSSAGLWLLLAVQAQLQQRFTPQQQMQATAQMSALAITSASSYSASSCNAPLARLPSESGSNSSANIRAFRPPTPSCAHIQRPSQQAEGSPKSPEQLFDLGARRGLKYETRTGSTQLVSSTKGKQKERLLRQASDQGIDYKGHRRL